MSNIIYFDESGYTGADLFNVDQEYFVYCGVNTTEADAKELLSQFPMQPNQKELKSQSLLKSSPGRKKIAVLLDQVADASYFMIYNKKYAATSWLFERFFEPIIRADSARLYREGFPSFVASSLYFSMILNRSNWELFWANLRNALSGSNIGIDELFKPFQELADGITDGANPTKIVFELILAHKEMIFDDLDLDRGEEFQNKWLFDNTLSALHASCVHFNESLPSIVVVCDEAKPLKDTVLEYYKRATREIEGALPEDDPHHILEVKFAKPIVLGNSQEYAGLQLADLLAGAIRYVVVKPDESWSKQVIKRFGERVNHLRIDFDKDDVDLENNQKAMKHFSFLVGLHVNIQG